MLTYQLRPAWALREDADDLRNDIGVARGLGCKRTAEALRDELATVEALIAEADAGARREGGGLRDEGFPILEFSAADVAALDVEPPGKSSCRPRLYWSKS